AAQGIGDGHAQIIVTVTAEDHSFFIRDPVDDLFDKRTVFSRDGIPYRVGDINDARPFSNHRFEYFNQIIDIAPGRILGGKLDVVAEIASDPYGLDGLLQNFFLRL